MDLPQRDTTSTPMTNAQFVGGPFASTADETLARMTQAFHKNPDRRALSTESVVVAFVSIAYAALKVRPLRQTKDLNAPVGLRCGVVARNGDKRLCEDCCCRRL